MSEENKHSGVEMTEEELRDYELAFQDIEESINMVMEEGEDL